MRALHIFSLTVPVLLLACKGKEGDTAGTAWNTGTTTVTTTPTVAETDGKLRLTILHTNDWQSHMLGFGPNAEYTPGSTGDDGTVGGAARLKTLVDQIEASSAHPVVLYDGGDWMAGAAFQLLATSHAAELQIMQAIGYDAITIGNHEFDWGPEVLGEMIATADAAGVTVPIISSNIHPSTTDAADDALEAHFDSGRIEGTRVETLDNGLTIGLLGLLGDEAQSITPAATPTTFSVTAEAAADAVSALEAQGVDLVIAITHNGVTDDVDTSPDHLLAMEVPQIGVNVGGHSHTPLHDVQQVGSTVIVQAGAYTQYLGQLDLAFDGSTWEVEGYQLHELDDTIAGDPEVTAMVDAFIADLDAGPLADLGTSFFEPIAAVPADMPRTSCAESGLGDFITDAYVSSMNATNPSDPIDFAFESQGVIRNGIVQGATGVQGFSDMFRVLPLGFGTDDVPGYALVDFYVTGDEVAAVCEVTASISPFYGCDYFIEMSGMRCTVDMLQTPFSRVSSVEVLQDGAWGPLDTSGDTLYHVAVDSYVASLMYVLEDLTSGLLAVSPRDAFGVPVDDLGTIVFDADESAPGLQELKLWQAIIQYAESFETVDGLPMVDESYATSDGRLIGYE